MAQLLGQADQIESLRQDLGDLQSVVTDAISHVGRIRCTSWRNPDKLACDIDISKLLDLYRYSVGKDQSNQLSHVVLIETIIDRLVLMLQLMNKFMDRIKMDEGSLSANQGRSIGIVAKRYWLRLVRIVMHLQQQANNPIQTNLSKASILEEPLSKNNLTDILKNKFGASNNILIKSPFPGQTSGTNTQRNISKEDSCKATQTAETLFVPCDSCNQTQNGLKNISTLISDIYTMLKIAKTAETIRVKDAWMTASEICTLVQATTINLRQIQEESLNVVTSIEPIKAQLIALEEKCKDLDKCRERLEKENKKKDLDWKNERERLEKDLESSKKNSKKMEDKYKESEINFNSKSESYEMEIKHLKSDLENMISKQDKISITIMEKEKLLKVLETDLKNYKEKDQEIIQLSDKVKELELSKEESLTNLKKSDGSLKC